jgi:cytochrome P450
MVYSTAMSIGTRAVTRRYRIFDWYNRIQNLFYDSAPELAARKDFFEVSNLKIVERLEREVDRPDFMSYIKESQKKPEKALTPDEVTANACLLLVAGSETTATMLTATTYLFLREPEVYAKLVREVRTRFKSQSEITVDTVSKLEYMIAVLQEGLRYYPPVPTGFPRIVPPEGDKISGYYVPGGVSFYLYPSSF